MFMCRFYWYNVVPVPPGCGSHKSPTRQGFFFELYGPSPGRLWTITRAMWTTTRALWTTFFEQIQIICWLHTPMQSTKVHIQGTPPHRRRYSKIMIFHDVCFTASAVCSGYYAIMLLNYFQNKQILFNF